MEGLKSAVQAMPERCLVTNHPQSDCSHQVLSMIGEPGTFDTLEAWEQFLTEVKAVPDSILKPRAVLHAEQMIALKRDELELDLSKQPLGSVLITLPGRFSPLATWEKFLAEMETMSDSLDSRLAILNAKQIIASKKWDQTKAWVANSYG